MNRLFYCIVLFIVCAKADWSNEQTLTLKRNEVHEMNIVVGANDTRKLQFHWTLFVDERLVILAKYDRFNHQTILKKEYKKNALRIDLTQEAQRNRSSPYLVIFFQNFDSKAQSATFKIATYGDVFLQ